MSHKPFDRFLLGVNYWPRNHGVQMWEDWHPEEIKTEFQQLADLGAQMVRIFLLWRDFQPQADVINLESLAKLDQLIETAKGVGLQVVPTLFTGHMSGENWDVPWRANRSIYSDPTMLRAEALLARTLAQRYRGESGIAFWDIANEPDFFQSLDHKDADWLWVNVIVKELRLNDPTHPVTLGLHLGSLESDNGFHPGEYADLIDFPSMHAYALYSSSTPDYADSLRSTYLVPMANRLTEGETGKLTLFEEFGATSHMISPQRMARYYSAVLYSLLGIESLGAFPWCYSDFTVADRSPYNTTSYEAAFGLVDANGKIKPAGESFARFAKAVAALESVIPWHSLQRAPSDAAIIIPQEYYHNPDESIDAFRNFRVLLNSFILARQAGLSVDFIPGGEPLGAYEQSAFRQQSSGKRFLTRRALGHYQMAILPSVPRRSSVTVHQWETLHEWVRRGGALYASYDGLAAEALVNIFGVQPEDAVPPDDIPEILFIDEADPAANISLRYPGFWMKSKHLWAHPLPGTKVIARDEDGVGALFFHPIENGLAALCTLPIERYLSEMPNAYVRDESWRLYRKIMDAANVAPLASVDQPGVQVSMMGTERPDHEEWAVPGDIIVVANHVPSPLRCTVTINTDAPLEQLVDLVSGESIPYGAHGSSITLPADDGRIFQLR